MFGSVQLLANRTSQINDEESKNNSISTGSSLQVIAFAAKKHLDLLMSFRSTIKSNLGDEL